jgi:hypothetical protein
MDPRRRREGGALEEALVRAMGSGGGERDRDQRPLFGLLARASGLPGVRANAAMVTDFARLAAAHGAAADALLLRMATLGADEAPGATELEFLPMCGVAGIGQRAADDPGVRGRMLAVLHDAAEDLRFRVRDEVAAALGRIGERAGDALAEELVPWMDGYFQASAVLRGLAHPGWLAQLRRMEGVVALLEAAFALARDAERSVARYPGHKALVEVLGTTPGVVAMRFGVPVFDVLEAWATVKDPVLREVVGKNVEGTRMAGRYADEVARVRRALEKTAPARRDPRTDVGPTRGRGRKRRR